MQWFDLLLILKEIKNLDTETTLGSGLLGSLYLILHFLFPSLFPLTLAFLTIIMILGGLIGSGIARLSRDKKINPALQEWSDDKKITSEKLILLEQGIESGLYPPDKGLATGTILIDQLLLGETSQDLMNLPELTEGKQQETESPD